VQGILRINEGNAETQIRQYPGLPDLKKNAVQHSQGEFPIGEKNVLSYIRLSVE